MAQEMTVSYKDAQTLPARNQFWVNDALTGFSALQHLANVSNAQIVSAYLKKPVVTTGFTLKPAPLAANNETVNTRAKVRMEGNDAGSVANPVATTLLSIPAPVGDLINGLTGNNNDARLIPLIAIVRADSDVAMQRITKVYYEKAR